MIKTVFISVDVEEWFQVENLRNNYPKLTWESQISSIKNNVGKVLSILKISNIKATFFNFRLDCPALS